MTSSEYPPFHQILGTASQFWNRLYCLSAIQLTLAGLPTSVVLENVNFPSQAHDFTMVTERSAPENICSVLTGPMFLYYAVIQKRFRTPSPSQSIGTRSKRKRRIPDELSIGVPQKPGWSLPVRGAFLSRCRHEAYLPDPRGFTTHPWSMWKYPHAPTRIFPDDPPGTSIFGSTHHSRSKIACFPFGTAGCTARTISVPDKIP
jgi:hypothetical protein